MPFAMFLQPVGNSPACVGGGQALLGGQASYSTAKELEAPQQATTQGGDQGIDRHLLRHTTAIRLQLATLAAREKGL